jgi:hypothetical protein
MRNLGEYVIPIAAIVLALVVELFLWEEIGAGWRLVKRLLKRLISRK